MKNGVWIILILILALQMVSRVPFLQEPLEGDEGVYALIGQGVVEGKIPYRDFFDHKPPVVYYVYALIFKLFGESILSIRLFTAFFGLLGTLGLFGVGRWLWGAREGLWAAGLYAFFSGGPLIEGASSNTESFMIVFVIFALLTYVLALKSGSARKTGILLLLSGFFSGLAVMTKQVALFNFLVLLGFLLPFRDFRTIRNWEKSIWMLIGFLIMPLVFVIYFWANQGLSDFIAFALLFNFGYVQSGLNLLLLVRTFYVAICENSIIWVLAAASVFYILRFKRTKWNLLMILWAVFSFAGITSGGHYFGHYYIQIIPAICLLSGHALNNIRFKRQSLNISAIVILVLLSFIIALNIGEFYFSYSPEEISFYKYGHPYNVIAQELGYEIGKRTGPEDYVFIIGLPQIHFYSKRKSPTKYYNFVKSGEYKVYLFGREIYQKKYVYRTDEELVRTVNQALLKGLQNKKTKFAIFQSKEFIQKDFLGELWNDFALSPELSGGGGTVLVFERKKK